MDNFEDIAIGYTIASGRLFVPFPIFHKAVEEIIGEPVFTHQMGNEKFWDDLKQKFEEKAIKEFSNESN